jgi:hypothetical protein
MHPNLFQRFFNTPSDGGGGTGAGPGAPAPATPSPTTGAPAGAPGAAGAGAAPAGGPPSGGAPQFAYTEDRSNWIPPYRLQEVNSRYQQLEQNFNTMRDRMAAMFGIGNQPDPQTQRVQEAMIQLFPGLGHLAKNPEVIERLMQMAQTGQLDEMQSAPNVIWKRHAAEMGRMGVETFARATGRDVKNLPPNTRDRILRELRGFIHDDPSGQRARRYEEGDPGLIDELVSDLTGFYVQPAQVQQNGGAAGLVARNRALPSSGPRTAPVPSTSGQPRTFANKKERFAAMRQELLAAQQT